MPIAVFDGPLPANVPNESIQTSGFGPSTTDAVRGHVDRNTAISFEDLVSRQISLSLLTNVVAILPSVTPFVKSESDESLPADNRLPSGSSRSWLHAPRPLPHVVENSPFTNSPAIPFASHAIQAYTETTVTITHELTTAITNQLSDESNVGATTVQIRLSTSELGAIDLQLSITNDVVSIRIIARDQLTRQAIESQINELQQSLAERGVVCGQCLVAVNPTLRKPVTAGESARTTGAKESTHSPSRWSRSIPSTNESVSQTERLDFVA